MAFPDISQTKHCKNGFFFMVSFCQGLGAIPSKLPVVKHSVLVNRECLKFRLETKNKNKNKQDSDWSESRKLVDQY